MNSFTSFKINRPRVVHEIIDGELILINFDSGNYYSCDKVAADIWALVAGGNAVGEIVEKISCRYDGNYLDMENAVKRFLAELHQEDLIVPVNTGGEKNIRESAVDPNSKSQPKKIQFDAPVLQKYSDMRELLLLDPVHEVDETGWPNITSDSPDKKA